jgi:thiol-disulfide isomerase/thioredoxin
MLIPILMSIAFVVLFIVGYKYFRGFYPGSSLVIMDPIADPDSPRLLFFYTTWCPHSQKALGEWRSLKQALAGKRLGGKRIQFVPYDGDSETGAVARYSVDAYPTVVLETTEATVHYDGPVKAARLREWLIIQLGPESGELASA